MRMNIYHKKFTIIYEKANCLVINSCYPILNFHILQRTVRMLLSKLLLPDNSPDYNIWSNNMVLSKKGNWKNQSIHHERKDCNKWDIFKNKTSSIPGCENNILWIGTNVQINNWRSISNNHIDSVSCV